MTILYKDRDTQLIILYAGFIKKDNIQMKNDMPSDTSRGKYNLRKGTK